jgi:alkylation response protein AidB-like acyl-CoA dehydrogenase
VIDGAKAFITNSGTPITSVITVTARTGERPDGRPEISALLVPAGTPGLVVERPYRKLGWHASDTHGLGLSDCRVPQEHLLGARGRGLQQFLAILDDGRIAFGRPIGANQGVAFGIADLAVAVEAARLLTYKAAWLKDEHVAGLRDANEVKQAAAIAKLYSSTAAVDATRLAAQVFGGGGFIEDHAVARFYRDAKILEIGEGTSEIQRLVIARGLGLPVR